MPVQATYLDIADAASGIDPTALTGPVVTAPGAGYPDAMARLQPIPPAELSSEQRVLHNDMRAMIGKHLQGFVSERGDGALIGPFAPLLHFPVWGGPVWEQTKSLMTTATLPGPVREIAILVTGAALGERYESYEHQHVAERSGLSTTKLATIAAGQRPPDLDSSESAVYDLAAALARGPVPELTYRAAIEAFGPDGVAELIYLVGGSCLVSTLLNELDVPVPDHDEIG